MSDSIRNTHVVQAYGQLSGGGGGARVRRSTNWSLLEAHSARLYSCGPVFRGRAEAAPSVHDTTNYSSYGLVGRYAQESLLGEPGLARRVHTNRR